jgi:tetratricopeptide (TPR) repeat protein
MKRTAIPGMLFFICLQAFSQTDTLRGEQATEVIKQITKQVIDTTKFLTRAANDACHCIDSINVTNKSDKEVAGEISACIDKGAVSYQMAINLYHSLRSGDKKVNLEVNKNSDEYKKYYYELEAWLRDSCEPLSRKVATNDKQSSVSLSKNPSALAAYYRGVDVMKKENYRDAADYFATALGIDSVFTFAWDNLGLCYRRMGRYDEALKAYNKSLSIDPNGKLPLHNIPVVYEYKQEYDKAIEAYLNILKKYPDDPEAYYGTGRIYISIKQDYEKGLQQMCMAYNIYTQSRSPYRVDAEKNIHFVYAKMKEAGREERFFEILEANNINTK